MIFIFTLLIAFITSFASSLPAPGNYNLDLTKYDFIDTTLNVIQFPKGNENFSTFYNKMDTLVFENKGKVRILHIGGSHIQADVSSNRIREHFIKEYPGASAGRGFIFPYSAARTNTPSSYGSYYKGLWDMNKNVQREIKKPLGLLGIAVSTSDPRAEIILLLDRYNSTPIWAEDKIRLFGYSDNNDVIPVLKLDSTEILGTLDSNSQSFIFNLPRPIDSIHIAFKWADSLKQAELSAFINDSLLQDSITKANFDSTKADTLLKDSIQIKDITNKLANLKKDTLEIALDSMFQGNCDILDTACLIKEGILKKEDINCSHLPPKTKVADGESEIDSTNTLEEHCIIDTIPTPDSLKQNMRPRFTLTGILTESNTPGISYTNVGINGAKVHDYFEEVCPLLEKELQFFIPDLVIFAIGINDANVKYFNAKQFKEEYEKLIGRIKKINPNVAIIFETNNDMFRKVKRKRFVEHPNGEIVRKAFFELADKYKAGVWDKFSIMGGLGSMAKWEKADLAKKDKVHFKLAGYHLLGDLFYKALIQNYQEHIANLPAVIKELKTDSTTYSKE